MSDTINSTAEYRWFMTLTKAVDTAVSLEGKSLLEIMNQSSPNVLPSWRVELFYLAGDDRGV